MTEIKRDLSADLAICSAAQPGPWLRFTEWGREVVRDDTFADVISIGGPHDGEYVDMSPEDATFIVEARTYWPHAIERAIRAEAEVESLRMQRDSLEATLQHYRGYA